ncbi:MAG: V-type ATPase subunit [Eubacteriaceae bacterium]
MSKSKHACVNTKALAMMSKKLKEDDYKELIKAKDLRGVVQYLNENTYYGDFLKKFDINNLHRSELEVHLDDLKVREAEKFLHYLSGNEKSFFMTFLVRLEVESLRLLIRGVFRKENLEDLENLLVYSKKYTKVPFDQLLKSKNWEDFKKFLLETDYYRLIEIYKELKNQQDLVMLEKSLDRYYYDLMKNRLLLLDKKSNKSLIEAQRRSIDLLNLVWIYRGKKFYELSREELIAYSLRGGFEINESKLLELVAAKNLDEIREILKNSTYSFIFNHGKTLDLFMERRRERYLYYMYLRLFNKDEGGVGRVTAYMRLLDFETEDLTSIIESKRYRMRDAEIKNYLIRPIN